MKSHRLTLPVFLAALTLLGASQWPLDTLHAQDDQQENTTSSNTYDSTGTVTAISAPLTITVNSRRGPFTYQLGPDLRVYGANGKSIQVADVKKEQTVTVYYYKRLGQETVARIVIVKPATKKAR